MIFPSQKEKETYDSNTPSGSSSRTSTNRQYRRSPKRNTIQSHRESISNSSVHTISPATTSRDVFNSPEQNSGEDLSSSHHKYLYSLEKATFRSRNQSQSSIDTVREAGSARGSIAASTPRQEIRSLNIPSFEDEDESPNDRLEASAPVVIFPDPVIEARAREARALESKVARVASMKFSVEEMIVLQKEVDRWLTEATAADASNGLFLSSLLLKTIIANHSVFSDTSKAAKNTETSLKLRVDDLEFEKGRLVLELREKTVQYNQKVQECKSLRIELAQAQMATPPGSGGSVPPVLKFNGYGEFAGLLYHSPHAVVYEEDLYPTALHLFEARKFLDHRPDLADRIRQCERVEDVTAISAELAEFTRRDWGNVALSTMDEVLYLKFRQHYDLRTLLLNTYPADLVYVESGDPFWGDGAGLGMNELGKSLMRVRKRLRIEARLEPEDPETRRRPVRPY